MLASIENGGGSSTPIGDGSNEFTLEVLSELSLQAQINVYAPILNENALSAPSVLNEDMIVGAFSATDPEGTTTSFTFMGQNPDFDMDGLSILSIDSETGQITIQDMDDLKLMDMDLINPILRVSDQSGLYSDRGTNKFGYLD